LQELNARDGLTSVIVTHDPTVGARTHRIVHMRDGMIDEHVINGRTTKVNQVGDSVPEVRVRDKELVAALA
jgi:ABC-type lipoprotein export system ATPase subunit